MIEIVGIVSFEIAIADTEILHDVVPLCSVCLTRNNLVNCELLGLGAGWEHRLLVGRLHATVE